MLLSVALPKLKDVKGSNAYISHGPYQRISCQFSDSVPSHQFATMPRRLPLQRCIYCKVTYCDPLHIQRQYLF